MKGYRVVVLLTVVLVALVAALAVTVGSGAPRWAGRYVGFVREHRELTRQTVPIGLCARLRCNEAVQPGSAYCSDQHELDDDYRAAGY